MIEEKPKWKLELGPEGIAGVVTWSVIWRILCWVGPLMGGLIALNLIRPIP